MKEAIKNLLRKAGFQIGRYAVQTSTAAQLQCLLQYAGIDLIIDVGANSGQYAMALRAHGYRGRIVSFEPLAGAHAQLQKAARGDAHWQVAQRMALGDAEGEVTIRVAGNSQSSSVLDMLSEHESAAPGSRFIGSELSPLRRVDQVAGDYMQGMQSVLLKIDTQGYEDRVLRGATGIMNRISAIQVELSLVPLYAGQLLFDEMRREIESLGYVLFAIFPGYVNQNTGQTVQVDGFFVRKSIASGS
ncbi:MAG: FkbM family methyltransferase [Betaproteobacteria bacterium]|nr:FkbM family methyltransferase [Betaproteobacteria bacterium]